jgi:23S rRNA (cytosine1962-C5)-methyltransferase
MAEIILKPGREKSIRQRHPWIFSGAVARVEGSPQTGETVAVRSDGGEILGWAAFSPLSQIQARMWSWDSKQSIDRDFFAGKIRRILARRQALLDAGSLTALRLCHAESDGLPGVVVDRYADCLVMQILAAGAEYWRETLAEIFMEQTGLKQVYERSDVEVRKLEGLEERRGPIFGETPERIQIEENGVRFWVDVRQGQKTGFYLDQRRNRQRVGELSAGRRVLNCFCYTVGFSLYALRGGAEEVISMDSSAEALALAQENMVLNGFSPEKASWIEADIFLALRKLRDQAQHFDAIILDPPKFAPTAAQAAQAARGYKDINLLAFKLLNPGGLLFTFSCSGGISAEFFQKIVAGAALDAQVDAVILEHLAQGVDHPVALNFPEGAYLKGLVCQVN